MNRILTGAKFEIKALNLNQFYSDVVKELGIKRLSSLELGVTERVHHRDKTRTVTTTQIAAGHEFGNSFTPPRPFLSTSANQFVNGDFKEDVKQDYTYLGAFLKRLAKKLYATTIECFMSGGFGTWLPLSEKYKQRTGRTDPPLVDTTKLMSSIYVKYEGYTVSGKTTGGRVSTSNDFFIEEDAKKDIPKGIKVSKKKDTKFENKKNEIKAITRKVKDKEETVESLRKKVSETLKKKYGPSYIYSDEKFELDEMTTAQEIRKRFKI